ncbi:hypothetical protein BJ138DRAFT_1211413, partial [Hygrophoropsis aurantiaca]
ERYRNHLRQRDTLLSDLRASTALHASESTKHLSTIALLEERTAKLEGELAELEGEGGVREVLDAQKMENLVLKETIDRMRWEMDEMRGGGAGANNAGGGGSGSAAGSRDNTMSKSLGAELMGQMWGMGEDGQSSEDEDEEADGAGEDGEEEGTDGEDVIQTIITRKKRKVRGRTTIEKITTTYSDASAQCDPPPPPPPTIQLPPKPDTAVCAVQTERSMYTTETDVQTDPSLYTTETDVQTETYTAETDVQTDVVYASVSISTDTDTVRYAEMDIQTDEPAEDIDLTADVQTEEDDDDAGTSTLASSSSTVLPGTPKGSLLHAQLNARLHSQLHEHPHDLPPSYRSITAQEEEDATLRRWHPGMPIPVPSRDGGKGGDEETDTSAIAEWRALKRELGVECLVIDKILESAHTQTQPLPRKIGNATRTSRLYDIITGLRSDKGKRVVVSGSEPDKGDEDDEENVVDEGSPLAITINVRHLLFCAAASAAVYLSTLPSPSTSRTGIMGWNTGYYDRAAWAGFNSMDAPGEGFGYDGTQALWDVLGRVGVGAARVVGGWPT